MGQGFLVEGLQRKSLQKSHKTKYSPNGING